jgi:hypothetical protein
MEEEGFYPPYQLAIGGLQEDKGGKKKHRRGEEVTFASMIIPPKRRGGMFGKDDELPSHQQVKQQLADIAKPRYIPNTRQPGTK